MGSDQALKDALQFLDAHVDMFDDPTVEHRGRDIASAALLLCLGKHPKHDPFLARKTVTNVRNIIEICHVSEFCRTLVFGQWELVIPTIPFYVPPAICGEAGRPIEPCRSWTQRP